MVDPSKKVPDLNCEAQDLLLEAVDPKQELPDLRSGGIPPPNITPGRQQVKSRPYRQATQIRNMPLAGRALYIVLNNCGYIFPRLFTVISEHISFLLLVFPSLGPTLFNCRFRAVD